MPPEKKSRSQKTRKRAKTGKPGKGPRLKVLLVSLCLLGLLLVGLIALSQMRQRVSPPLPAPPVKVVEPAVTPEPSPATLLEDIRVEVESLLLHSGIALSQVEISRSGDLFRYEVQGAFPPETLRDELSRRLSGIAAGLRLETLASEGELRVYRGESRIYLLHFRPPPTPPPAPMVKARARAAIIMDDLGRDLETARALLAIDLPVTFAILPGEAHAAEVATLAHRSGREVMIHIPMEPQSYPATNPGDDALLLGQSPEEIRRRFQEYVERVPFAVGGNNRMGSRFTEYREGMEVVLATMKASGLFFVDSRTTGQSLAFDEARRAGVPAAARDLFLDNEQDVGQISREIRKLAILAGRKGQAVGICHPYEQTLEALRREAPYLKQQGIEIVPVSQLLVR
jgi:polysaccharide deacetylase 2 family uncharacterized protein YibQ